MKKQRTIKTFFKLQPFEIQTIEKIFINNNVTSVTTQQFQEEYRMNCSQCDSKWMTKISPDRISICPFCGADLSITLQSGQVDNTKNSVFQNRIAGQYNKNIDLFEYMVENSEICIRRCNQNSSFFSENIIIPAFIDNLPVTNIFKDAFKSCDRIFSISLPEGIKKIGISAFYGCSNLRLVQLPESLEIISSGAFCGCRNLKRISIPSNVHYLGGRAFENCHSLKEVVLPEIISDIGVSMFYNCYSLENIILPDEITAISKDAFSGCISLQEIIIPPSVTSIGKRAFYNCNHLKSIYIPESVNKIGVLDFYKCSNITIHAQTLTYAEEYAKSERIRLSNKGIYS